jgi:hypothetical protein
MEDQLQEAAGFNLLAFVVLLALTYWTWVLPRRLAMVPLLVMTCLMPLGQQLVLFGLHFFLFRVLLLVGILRVCTRGEARQLVWIGLDKLFVWWVIVSIVFGTLVAPSIDLFRSRLGDAYNALGCYFFIRCVVVDFDDLMVIVRVLAWLSLVVAGLMVVEKVTGHNPFAVFGVPALTLLRNGHLRCQGAFRHPILAGSFGAAQLPLFVGFWVYRPQHRRLAAAGILAVLVIVATSCSSGALLAAAAAVGGLGMWKWRQHLRLFRWATVITIVALALVMKAPVWYLLDRVSGIVGGGGWHRAYLIDQAIGHLNEWWLFGTTYTAHWGPGGEVNTDDSNMMDITNQYIVEGVKGGLLKLVLFLAIIFQCFKGIGRQMRTERLEPRVVFLLWCLGVSLVTHCVSFVSTSYFDQTILIWYWLLATIARIACSANEPTWSTDSQATAATAAT